jgi:hypothetical protein
MQRLQINAHKVEPDHDPLSTDDVGDKIQRFD